MEYVKFAWEVYKSFAAGFTTVALVIFILYINDKDWHTHYNAYTAEAEACAGTWDGWKAKHNYKP